MKNVFCLTRDIFDHPLLKDPVRFKTWVWMISQAAWKRHRIEVNGQTIWIERGQFSHSIRFIADKNGMTKSAMERFLTRLKTGTLDEPMIETKTEAGQLVITLCNFNKYQLGLDDTGTAIGTGSVGSTGTGPGQERDRSGTKKNQGNQENQENHSDIEPTKSSTAGDLLDPDPPPKSKSRKKPTKPFPSDWEEDPMLIVADQKNADKARQVKMTVADVQRETENFRNHHVESQTRSPEWNLRWNTWCNNFAKFNSRAGGTPSGNRIGKNAKPPGGTAYDAQAFLDRIADGGDGVGGQPWDQGVTIEGQFDRGPDPAGEGNPLGIPETKRHEGDR